MRRVLKEYFDDIYNIDTQEQFTCVDLIGFGKANTSEESLL